MSYLRIQNADGKDIARFDMETGQVECLVSDLGQAALTFWDAIQTMFIHSNQQRNQSGAPYYFKDFVMRGGDGKDRKAKPGDIIFQCGSGGKDGKDGSAGGNGQTWTIQPGPRP
jgi:hypothetical protein